MGRLAASAAIVFVLLTFSHGHHLPKLLAAPAAHGSNQALANQMAASRYGWTGGQDACLDDLWIHESGFRSGAVNPSSGATGIPQLLPGVHQVPANWSDPAVQIRWGLDYLHGTYGTPCAAWSAWQSRSPHWY